MRKINKRNAKQFTIVALGVAQPCNCVTTELTANDIPQDREMVEYMANLYSRLHDFRMRRKRCVDYYFGRQLRDMVKDPDTGRMIPEEELLHKNGYPKIITNIIYKMARVMVSQYSASVGDPYCVARDRDEQKVGEMLSAALQYSYQKNALQVVNTNSYLEFVLSALPGWRVGYNWNEEQKQNDVYVEPIDDNRIIFDNNTGGLYFDKVQTIGYLHDMTESEVDDLCGGDLAKMRFFREHYAADRMANTTQTFKESTPSKNFYQGDADKCRVIEVWFKREEPSIRYWDTLRGELKIVPRHMMESVYAENEQRKAEMAQYGGNVADAALNINIEPFTYRYWVCRYMTPEGYIIKEVESPYWHNSHPFVLGAYPMIDGEIHSLTEISLPMQKAFNRLKQRIEFMRMSAAKGVLIVPKQLLKGISLKEVAKQWAKSNGVIALDWKEGVPMPQQISSSASSVGDMEMLQMEMSLLEDVIGFHRAMQGGPAQSGTPAALYAMELQNSQTSTSDIISWYNGLVRKRDTKIVQLIQQYYDTPRYMNLVGKDYKEESKWYDPEKCRNAQVDVNIIEGSSSSMFRSFADATAMELLKMGGIDIEMYLENSSAPFADRMLEAIRSKKKEMEEQQMQMQSQGQQPNPMIAQAMGGGIEMPQGGEPGASLGTPIG